MQQLQQDTAWCVLLLESMSRHWYRYRPPGAWNTVQMQMHAVMPS